MSIESWHQEFLPHDELNRLCELNEYTVEVAEHTKRKFIGLREENLKKHGLTKNNCFIEDKSEVESYHRYLQIAASCCAYCQITRNLYGGINCNHCPVAKHGIECDDRVSAYKYFLHGNPEPMIELMDRIIAKG